MNKTSFSPKNNGPLFVIIIGVVIILAGIISFLYLNKKNSANNYTPPYSTSTILKTQHYESKNLKLANWPFKDTDRLWSFYSAAVENDRLLAISTKQAYLLEQLHSTGADVPRLDDKNIRIFLTRRGWGFLGSDAPKSEIERDYSYTKWELPYLDHKNTVTYKDIQGDYSRYVLRADLFDMTELIDIKPPEGSIYIRSVVEPFDDEMRVSEQKLDNWLSLFKLTKYQAHCSGHAPGSDLKRIVEEISPKTVIPIHTTNPLKFKEWGFNVCLLESSVKTSF